MVDLDDSDDIFRRARREIDEQRQQAAAAQSARSGTLTYTPRAKHSFFQDIGRRALYGPGDSDVAKRIDDHKTQVRNHSDFREYRVLDESAGSAGGFVPPRYIESAFEVAAHPQRAVADLCQHFELPSKTGQLVVPAWSSGAAVGVDSSQGTTLSEGDPVDVAITANVVTIAGTVQASQQLLDQSSPDARIDELVAQDLGAAYGSQLDLSLLTGAGGSGAITGLLNTSGVLTLAATNSPNGLQYAIAAGYQQMVQTRYRKPNVCIMHPRRWLSGFANAIDLQGRPLMLPNTSPAALVGTANDSVVAEWLGMRVILDTNIPTTSGSGAQDYVILGYSPDWLLYESPLRFHVNKQQGGYQMSVGLMAWRYAAFVVRHPSSVCLVGPFNAPVTQGS